MSTITRCPNCHTAFRVTPTQLNTHDGQVRCGLCAHIFDGFQYLSSLETQSKEQNQSASEAAIKNIPETSIDVRASIASARKEPELGDIPNLERSAISWDDSILQHPTPKNEGLFKIGTLILTIMLILQSVYQFRSYVAASYPKTKPMLQTFCGLPFLNCDIPLWRGSEPPEVISSEFRADPDHANVFILTVVLRNKASIPQAYPNLALTLTDNQGEVFASRILRPADYLKKNNNLQQGIAPRDEVVINVFIDSQNVNATGFGIYPFYS